MIKIKDIAFTAYPVTDIPRARAFYKDTLGLTETKAEDFGGGNWWIEYDIGHGTLALHTFSKPSGDKTGPNIALEVENLDDAYAHCQAAGLPPLEISPGQTIMDSPVCRFFFITDPDGNGINIHQCKHAK
jgi:catechol 2,3-dioxygenase-like lactoylglutathione lyase family enzyme